MSTPDEPRATDDAVVAAPGAPQDERGPTEDPMEDPPGPDASRPDLLATAESLARGESAGRRGSSSTVRRPRRVVRGPASDPTIDDATEPERVRVRSTTEERPASSVPSGTATARGDDSPPGAWSHGAATPDVSIPGAATLDASTVDGPTPSAATPRGSAAEPSVRDAGPPAGLLGADGQPLPDATPSGTAEPETPPQSSSGVRGRTLDASVFLVDAVRGYLEAVDQHGLEAAITDDRRTRLRRTLELWDRQGD